MTGSISEILTGSGALALIIAVVVAIINGVFGRGKSRADAAKLISDAAGGFVTDIRNELRDCKTELRDVSEAAEVFADGVEEVLPQIASALPDVASDLRKSLRALRRVV